MIMDNEYWNHGIRVIDGSSEQVAHLRCKIGHFREKKSNLTTPSMKPNAFNNSKYLILLHMFVSEAPL